jgi:hypothetical protein
MSYDDFKTKVADTLRNACKPLTWTEVRTLAGLPQAFPNNQWVHRMEQDIGLARRREADGIIHWELRESLVDATPTQTPDQTRSRPRRKQGAVE